MGLDYDTLGARYIKHLEDFRMEGFENYTLALEAIEQGKTLNNNDSNKWAYYENTMADNFIREFDKLNGESVMGIYSAIHTGLNSMDYMTKSVPSMANQINKLYGDAVYSEDISWLVKDIEPLRYDIITVNGKDYEASYYGTVDITGIEDFVSREFWRLENAYDDFRNNIKTIDKLPYSNYPMLIDKEQVFIIDYTTVDGTVIRKYYRSDGYAWNGMDSTVGFKVD